MMHQRFSAWQTACLISSIAYFTEKLFSNLRGIANDPVIEEWKTEHGISGYVEQHYDDFTKIIVHCFPQVWGSTACGWGGMGGAAMTSSYTVAIHNPVFQIIAVFWDGRLAYVVEADEKSLALMRMDAMPGYSSVNKLKLLYKPTSRT